MLRGGLGGKNRLERKVGQQFAGIIVDGTSASKGCSFGVKVLWITL